MKSGCGIEACRASCRYKTAELDALEELLAAVCDCDDVINVVYEGAHYECEAKRLRIRMAISVAEAVLGF